MRLWTGEWFYDLSEGTAWIDGVLGHGTETSSSVVIYDRILSTQGCSEIVPDSFTSSLDRDTRHLSVSCTINTIYGTGEVAT